MSSKREERFRERQRMRELEKRAARAAQAKKNAEPWLDPSWWLGLPADPGPPPEPVPVFSECVIGYRWFYIDALGRLRPQNYNLPPWKPGVNVARCDAHLFGWSLGGRRNTHKHKAPAPDCGCGLYARFSLAEVPEYQEVFARPGVEEAIVLVPLVGAVAAWGDLQIHRDGMRAEHACVVALATLPGMPEAAVEVVRGTADRYGVVCVPVDALEMEASVHGTPLPESVRPPKPAPPEVYITFNTKPLLP